MEAAKSYLAPKGASKNSDPPSSRSETSEADALESLRDFLEEHQRWVRGDRADEPRHGGLDLVGFDLRDLEALKQDHLTHCDLTDAILPDPLNDYSARLSLIEEASKNCRALFLTKLAVCTFLIISVGKMDDATLILGGTAFPLPLVETEVPALGFLYASPFFLAGLYFYFMLYLQRLWELVARLPAVFPDGRGVTETIYPWLLVGTIKPHFPLSRRSASFTRLQYLAGSVLAFGLAPLTAWFVWYSSLPRLDPWLNGVQMTVSGTMSLFAILAHARAGHTLSGQDSRSPPIKESLAYGILATFLAAIVLLIQFEWRPRAGRLHAVDAQLSGEDLRNKDLVGANLVNAKLSSADLRGADLSRANLSHADLQDANLEGAILDKANLAYAQLNRSNLKLVSMNEANLSGAELEDIWMWKGNLEKANLSGSELDRARVLDSNWKGAQLSGASLRWARVEGVALEGANLSDTSLQNANLSRSNLQHTGLRDAVLQETVLTDALLGGAVAFRLHQFEQGCGERSVAVSLTEGEGLDLSAHFGWKTLRPCAMHLDRLQRQVVAAEKSAREAKSDVERKTAQKVELEAKKAFYEAESKRAEARQEVMGSRVYAMTGTKAEDVQAILPPFDDKAAANALEKAAAGVDKCRSFGDERGTGRVAVTFGPTGAARNVRFLSGPYLATAIGACVSNLFEQVKVPPFSGSQPPVVQSFELATFAKLRD